MERNCFVRSILKEPSERRKRRREIEGTVAGRGRIRRSARSQLDKSRLSLQSIMANGSTLLGISIKQNNSHKFRC